MTRAAHQAPRPSAPSPAAVCDIIGNGKIDWTVGEIRVIGRASIPTGMSGDAGFRVARERAIWSARRDLYKIAPNISVGTMGTIATLMADQENLAVRVKNTIAAAPVYREKPLNDGYEVVVVLPIYGEAFSLATAINFPAQLRWLRRAPETLPIARAAPPVLRADASLCRCLAVEDAEEMPIEQLLLQYSVSIYETPDIDAKDPATPTFTGVIIDCRGLPLARSMCPRIFDETGANLLGAISVPPQTLNSRGVVAYYASTNDAIASGRVGENPLLITVQDILGDAQTDLRISAADAEGILAANGNDHFLDTLSVAILVDR